MDRVPPSCGHRPVQGESHDQDQAVETVVVADLRVFNAETARFKVGKHRLDAPALSVFQGPQITRPLRQGDDPRFGMAGILEDADVGGIGAGRCAWTQWAYPPSWLCDADGVRASGIDHAVKNLSQ